jgi:hypothetical protein
LFEAEEVLRSGVAPEPEDHKAASRLALERALYPPKTSAGFPLRWSMVYSMAAALTVTVLAGYLSTRERVPETTELAVVPQAAGVAPAESAAAPGLREQPGVAVSEQVQASAPAAVDSDALAQITTIEPATGNLPQSPATSDVLENVAEPATSERAAELARFELAAADERNGKQLETTQVAWIDPPKMAPLPANVPVAALMSPPVPTFRTVVQEVVSGDSSSRISDPETFSKVIEGYWLLTQAKVWEEDLQPAWTSRGLVIEGTVEDEAVRERVEAAVARQASQPTGFRVRLREDLPATQQRVGRRPRVVHEVYGGPAGGAVRRSLLSHFSDAARQSFVAPQPSALEAEVVRFVSEVYRSQSELLSHAYALQRFLGRVEGVHLASAGPQTTRRFRDLVRFHLRALDEREAAIYDRLSEALPRKVWSHRGSADVSGEASNWSEESQSLLQDTLELDSNLTALFGSSSLMLDARDPEQSCGELLHRIRTRIQRIKNRTQAL